MYAYTEGVLSLYRVDRTLALYLPRLSVLLSIEANRPRAWFSGPLGQYQAWLTGIQLISEFERLKSLIINAPRKESFHAPHPQVGERGRRSR